MAEDFDAMEACCKTVVTRVEPEICNCLFSGFILNTEYTAECFYLPIIFVRCKGKISFILRRLTIFNLYFPNGGFLSEYE
jgi:hypothetical protein